MKKLLLSVLLLLACGPLPIHADRIKDLADIAGVRSNQLIGFGLVAGLSGTGDGKDLPLNAQGLKSLLSGLGVSVDGPVTEYDLGESILGLARQNATRALPTDNMAAVLVTAEMPPFAKPGQKIDVNISAIGTAENLRGGALMMTELRGIDGRVYALAQGPLTATGVAVEAAGSSLEVGVPTSARIPNGGIIERVIETPFESADHIIFNVRDADFSTANAITTVINDRYGEATAVPLDSVSVAVRIPRDPTQKIAFISEVESLDVNPGEPTARVVINSRTGTAVINRAVKVSAAAVLHGTLMVRVTAVNEVSQPEPFSTGQTVGIQNALIEAGEQSANMFVFESGVDLQEIVDAVNSVGATPSALIAILEALKRSGSLKAELVVI